MKWLAVILILVVGCGEDRPRVVDPLLLPYVEEFEAAAGFPVGVSVIFGDVGALGMGVCYDDTVTMDRTFWDYLFLNDLERECAVFHELGHCALGRGHRNDRDGAGFILSIMEESGAVCFGDYAEHRDYYLNELFDP